METGTQGISNAIYRKILYPLSSVFTNKIMLKLAYCKEKAKCLSNLHLLQAKTSYILYLVSLNQPLNYCYIIFLLCMLC